MEERMTRKAMEAALEPASTVLDELSAKDTHVEFVQSVDSLIEELTKLKNASAVLCQAASV
jgi:hypothetical protein